MLLLVLVKFKTRWPDLFRLKWHRAPSDLHNKFAPVAILSVKYGTPYQLAVKQLPHRVLLMLLSAMCPN